MQEPIISEELFDRVQELRSHKRRNTKTGRKSLFAGLLYCPDCGAKLHFCAAKSLKLNQEFYRCANYNSGRGTCDIHYIRNVVLEQIVAEAVGSLADFVRCYESVFLYLLAKNNTAARQSEVQKLKQTIATSERRIKAIDKAIEELFEANISGKITDARFMKMTANYEREQKELLEAVADGNKKLQASEQRKVDLKLLMKALRDYTDIRQLTPEIVNALIRRIEVHSKDKKGEGGHFPYCRRTVHPADGTGAADGDGGDTPKPAAVRNFCIKQNTVQPPFSGLYRILHNYFAMGLCLFSGGFFSPFLQNLCRKKEKEY